MATDARIWVSTGPAQDLPADQARGVSLAIVERTPFGAGLNYQRREVARFELRYFADTHEVAVISGGEIVHSELLERGK